MNARTAVIVLAGAGLAVLFIAALRKQAEDGSAVAPHEVNSRHGHARVANVVEKTLQQHEGEDTPFVQAFEQALEEETRHESDLAKSAGLRA